ncbi:MAG: NADH-quinone oxidoreductase subunit NuoN [Alphaproteobacteria bacterium]|nr:NADH-quinone oxidoreductase subunit NuoN [Alphaproteobacteria bacterium]QQS56282.1 MAG: NADH-quinone oxidoreductase subunit NuoN [Alphaproteobacteria bacterium]
MNDFSLIPLLPEILLAVSAMVLLILGVFMGNRSTTLICWLTCAGFAVAACLILNMPAESQTALNGMFIADKFSALFKILILMGLIASLALSVEYLQQERMARFEYPVLITLAGIGMMLMVSANNFLSLYMALELQSLSLYILAAFHRSSIQSAEAAIKYFVLGALSSGMLLFGISLIYGFTGSVDFGVIRETLLQAQPHSPGVTIGMAFLLAGLAFKISAVPFHMWTPDVYQGAPTSVTAFFAMVPKIAAMGLLLRVLTYTFSPVSGEWMQIVYFLSVASMVVGAFAALAQDDIKRLMAYSSIGNMGYALIGLVAGTPQGVGAVILYLSIYMIMTAGVFAVILCMRREGIMVTRISDLSGLSRNRPLLAYAMAALMFSLSGIPPLAGFFGKLFIFLAAVEQGLFPLVILGVLSSVVSAYYYLRIIKVMFFDEATQALDPGISFERKAILLCSVIFILGFIVKPNFLVDSAMNAASALSSSSKAE